MGIDLGDRAPDRLAQTLFDRDLLHPVMWAGASLQERRDRAQRASNAIAAALDLETPAISGMPGAERLRRRDVMAYLRTALTGVPEPLQDAVLVSFRRLFIEEWEKAGRDRASEPDLEAAPSSEETFRAAAAAARLSEEMETSLRELGVNGDLAIEAADAYGQGYWESGEERREEQERWAELGERLGDDLMNLTALWGRSPSAVGTRLREIINDVARGGLADVEPFEDLDSMSEELSQAPEGLDQTPEGLDRFLRDAVRSAAEGFPQRIPASRAVQAFRGALMRAAHERGARERAARQPQAILFRELEPVAWALDSQLGRTRRVRAASSALRSLRGLSSLASADQIAMDPRVIADPDVTTFLRSGLEGADPALAERVVTDFADQFVGHWRTLGTDLLGWRRNLIPERLREETGGCLAPLGVNDELCTAAAFAHATAYYDARMAARLLHRLGGEEEEEWQVRGRWVGQLAATLESRPPVDPDGAWRRLDRVVTPGGADPTEALGNRALLREGRYTDYAIDVFMRTARHLGSCPPERMLVVFAGSLYRARELVHCQRHSPELGREH